MECGEKSQLKVLVVGGGIGGLTAGIALRQQGHIVQIFEQSRFANEAGAAIHMVPNATSVLRKLGIEVAECGADLQKRMQIVTAGNELVSDYDNAKDAVRWKSDWRMAHRAHLHKLLWKTATSVERTGVAVTLHTERKVLKVDARDAIVFFTDGSTVSGDVIVGADGVQSVCRDAVDEHIRAAKSAHSAFRFIIPKKTTLADPETAALISEPGIMKMWYAKDRKIVYYPCANDTILNFVCIHPAHLSATSDGYDAGANKSQLLDVFSGFHKSILALLGKADPQTLKVYPLFDMDTLPTFIADRLALIGDAAHPFLPHLAQGGAMAIEDAVALGVMLGNNATRESVPDRLNMYNEARYERATRIQHYTRLVGGDGLDQKEEVDDFALHKYIEYGFSHDEIDASTELLHRRLSGQ